MIPLELITFIGSTLIGGVLSLLSMKSKAKSDREAATLKALNASAEITKDAREHSDKGFLITRRFIAISCTLAIVVLPLVVPFFTTGIPVMFGYTELNPGFWPFTSDIQEIIWRSVDQGIMITPFHTHMMSAITGMYFGTSLKR